MESLASWMGGGLTATCGPRLQKSSHTNRSGWVGWLNVTQTHRILLGYYRSPSDIDSVSLIPRRSFLDGFIGTTLQLDGVGIIRFGEVEDMRIVPSQTE